MVPVATFMKENRSSVIDPNERLTWIIKGNALNETNCAQTLKCKHCRFFPDKISNLYVNMGYCFYHLAQGEISQQVFKPEHYRNKTKCLSVQHRSMLFNMIAILIVFFS